MAAAVAAAVMVAAVPGGLAVIGVSAVGEGARVREERREFFQALGSTMGTQGLVVILLHADFGDIPAVGAFVVEQWHGDILGRQAKRLGDKKLPGRTIVLPGSMSFRSSDPFWD